MTNTTAVERLPEDIEKRWNSFKHANLSNHSQFYLHDKETTIELYKQFLLEELSRCKSETLQEVRGLLEKEKKVFSIILTMDGKPAMTPDEWQMKGYNTALKVISTKLSELESK